MTGARPRTQRPPPAAEKAPPPRRHLRLLVGVRAWLARHAQAALGALGRFLRSPVAAVMSVLVVAIAAALPALLYVLLDNTNRLLASWEGAGSLTLFLRPEVTDAAARKLADQIAKREDVARVQVVGRSEGLAEFRRLSGFGAALDVMGENPFPAVLVVHARPGDGGGVPATPLLEALQKLPEADVAQADQDWVRRFQGFAAVGQRITNVLAALLAAGVLFVIGNTLRLEIRDRHPEIEITALVGGTPAFIRRPFLYLGLWLGLLGGLVGWLLTVIALVAVDGPVSHLASLYQSDFALRGGGFSLFAAMIGAGTLLGLAGAWLAVGRRLGVALPH
jgi:cell division transport system permease protein